MNKRVAIIGAGGTGRGFIPRLLQEDQVPFDLIDRDPLLVKNLQDAGSYCIEVGEDAQKVRISSYRAFETQDPAAAQVLVDASIIFTAVGENHLAELTPLLSKAISLSDEPLKIVVCENGISPKLVLRRALEEVSCGDRALVTQGVIFCTSIPKQGTKLDIVSENYPDLPVDMDEELFAIPFPHFVGTKGFDRVLERKIYTYNCLSACISYLGAYLGYTIYADAANDDTVIRYCDHLLKGLNTSLCREMSLQEDDQYAFSQRALRKFKNPLISDTIRKNSRDVMRKLTPTERIMGPMRIMRKYQQDPFVLEVVSAAALIYFDQNEKKDMSQDTLRLRELNPQLEEAQLTRIETLYEALTEGKSLDQILEEHVNQGVNQTNY